MKKVLPFIIIFVAILVSIGAYLLIKNKGNVKIDSEAGVETVKETPLEKRPVVSLMPSDDGHWLKMEIKKIVIDAATLDYEMTYRVADGRMQGVPGTVKLTTKDDIEKDLLLGSESSGKFRYDEGVENGNLSLKFRSEDGKLVAKFETPFKLYSSQDKLESEDGIFSINLEKTPLKTFFVVMNVIGHPGDSKFDDNTGFYGLFASSDDTFSGTVDIKESSEIKYWDANEWISDYQPIRSGIYTGN